MDEPPCESNSVLCFESPRLDPIARRGRGAQQEAGGDRWRGEDHIDGRRQQHPKAGA